MPKDQQREIAAQGGRSVPDEKRSFSQDHDLASRAGQQSHSGSQSGSNSRSGSDNGNSRNH